CVVAGVQLCYDCRLPCVPRGQPGGDDLADLVACNDPTDNRMLPVIIRGDQSTTRIMTLQCRITKHIGNSMLSKLRANSANNDSLRFLSLNNESSNHDVVTRLHKAASAKVAED